MNENKSSQQNESQINKINNLNSIIDRITLIRLKEIQQNSYKNRWSRLYTAYNPKTNKWITTYYYKAFKEILKNPDFIKTSR